MARISTYEFDNNITVNDMLIGTDGDPGKGLATKNFSVGEFAEFVMKYIEEHSWCCAGTTTTAAPTTTTTTIGPTVQICDLEFTAYDLDVTETLTGQQIPISTTAEEWHVHLDNGTPTYCYQDFNPNTVRRGLYYNWAAAQLFTPSGWRVPTFDDVDKITRPPCNPYQPNANLYQSANGSWSGAYQSNYVNQGDSGLNIEGGPYLRALAQFREVKFLYDGSYSEYWHNIVDANNKNGWSISTLGSDPYAVIAGDTSDVNVVGKHLRFCRNVVI
jgi:uncharacterized protein (TIGR02145 family)